jgi:DNA-binding SARP family transcriptional activator/tetratricopeptide (TPR) repeat protein
MIVLRALGTAEIDTGVTTLTPSQEVVFAAALYLILERGKRVSRARLASLLWPRVPEKARAHRLRQTVLQLKKLGVMVRADRDNLQLSEFDAHSDVEELSAPDLAPVLRKDSLEFLPGYSPRLSESLRDWVDTQREQIQGLATRRLVEALNGARQKGDWSTSEQLALICYKLDPFNEMAIIARAEASAMRGNKKEAVAILDRYLEEMGSKEKYMTLSAVILRKRITEKISERSVQECAFVGRSLEMEKLSLRLTAARAGNGGGFLVVGEAGIGKSRLAQELAKRAELNGVIVERTVCKRPDLDRPLSVFVDLVPRLRELRGALGCSSETIGVLKRLTEVDPTGADAIAKSDSSVLYATTRRALFDLFDAIADEQCVLIVVEDIQWLDPASATLLGAMVPWANAKKLFFLLNQRPGINPLSSQISAVDLPVVGLSGLAASSARTLLAGIFRDQSGAPKEDLIEKLLAIGEGNPFFLQELGKHWIESGGQLEFPPSIAAVVDDRLSHLSGEALQVLQACAVLGLNATIERIERLLEYKSHRLLSAVQELSVSAMLHEEFDESTDIPEKLVIRHDLLATAALRRLAKTALAFLHRRAGTVLQQETLDWGGTSTALLWACALHWRNAGDRERSFGAARACAEHLLEVGLSLDSAYAFERTLDYCVTDEQRLTILSRLAVARQMHGDWEKAKEALQQFRRIRATTAPDANAHDEAEFALFDSTWRASLENSALLNDLVHCITSKEASATHRVACGLLALKVASSLNEIRTMKEVYQTIIPLVDSSSANSYVRPEIDMVFHSACGDIGKLIVATKAFLGAVRNETNLLTLSRGLVNAATAYRLAGEREEAESLLREALDHALAQGASSRAIFVWYSLARLYLAAGDIQRAREALDRSESLADFGEDVHLISDRNYLQARVALEEGNIAAASAYYALTLAETNSNQTINRRSSVAALGIMVGVSNGTHLHSLRPLVADLESMHLQNRALGWQDFEAQALFVGVNACGETEKAHRLLEDYATTYRRERWPLPRRLSELRRLKSQPNGDNSGSRKRTPTERELV